MLGTTERLHNLWPLERYSAPQSYLVRWRRNVPPKRRFLQEPYGVTSQKTAFYKKINLLNPPIALGPGVY
jgi:hypothetical protein